MPAAARRSNLAQLPSSDSRFRALFDAHHADLLAYFLRRVDPNRAHDLAAEVFVVAWRRLEDVPPGQATLPWLYGVARLVLSNQRRAAGRFTKLIGKIGARQERNHAETPETLVIRSAEQEAVIAGIERLRDDDREVIRFVMWEELPHAEVGEILGCSAKAVGMRLHRALDRLQKELKRAGYDPNERGRPRSTTEGGE